MKFVNSEALLDLLVSQFLITEEQKKFITLEKGKQRQKLRKQMGTVDDLDKDYPDLIDIIVSFKLTS